MDHILDNPVYYALSTGNANLANGTEDIKYFSAEVSPFAGFKETTPDSFRQLFDLVPHSVIAFESLTEIDIPLKWTALHSVPGLQLVYKGGIVQIDETNLVELADEHIPQMLELTKLTNPGPFASRTIDFGHYRGIFDGDKLVAMAGQRMNPLPYAEISAVCTHPDHTGKGYAKQLLQQQCNRIMSEGNIPFLHVKDDNERAIKVYESLGFEVRTKVYFYILKKNS